MKYTEIDLTGVRTLLLDRDGVINRLRPNDYVKKWEEFEFLPGVLDFLKAAASMVERIYIVTNQRGVGKGVMSEDDLKDVHARMIQEVSENGGRIDHIYYCTAVSNEDHNRKPNPGMWEQIKRDHPEVDADSTLMIGDSKGDQEFAQNINVKFVLFQ